MSALWKPRRLWWDGFILGGDLETALTLSVKGLVGTLPWAKQLQYPLMPLPACPVGPAAAPPGAFCVYC
jgi:hypothetical protein